MGLDAIIATAVSSAVFAGIAGVVIHRHRQRERHDQARLETARAEGMHLPPSLHPLIDPERCIGSLSCVQACPEGDVLGIVKGVGSLIAGANCIGHGRCEAECPVGAIRLVFGTSERGVDIPRLSGDFESNVPGLYLAGELGGMGLIRNAVRQGAGAVQHLAGTLAAARRDGVLNDDHGIDDLVIVGAGPAGFAAALAAKEAGLRFRVLEQDSFGGTVANYPRQKIVLTEPVDLPLAGRIHSPTMAKEDLLALWSKLRERFELPVRESERVEDVRRENGFFEVSTAGTSYRAWRVLLAIGRRGRPRKLGVPGEELPNVTYRLSDPSQYRGRPVLVVGGGDSAVEAASALVDAGGDVALSYRGQTLSRCKPPNRERVTGLIDSGRLRPLLGTVPKQIEPSRVQLARAGGDGASLTIPAEFVIICAGGELPTALLQRVGVSVDRHYGAPL